MSTGSRLSFLLSSAATVDPHNERRRGSRRGAALLVTSIYLSLCLAKAVWNLASARRMVFSTHCGSIPASLRALPYPWGAHMAAQAQAAAAAQTAAATPTQMP